MISDVRAASAYEAPDESVATDPPTTLTNWLEDADGSSAYGDRHCFASFASFASVDACEDAAGVVPKLA